MLKGFEPRLYQQTILHTAVKKNTLVVIPTGLGKTNIALMLAANRLTNYPEGKILILAPTKPLCEQHKNTMTNHLNLDPEEINVFTGMIKPEKREALWKKSKVIVSTPQGLENDIISKKISLKDVCLLVFDEAHRAVSNYSYVFIAKQYQRQAEFAKILGLTASPGSDLEKIKEVCKNLYVEEIEVRSYEDPDVKNYVQETDVEWVKITLPEEFNQIINYLRTAFQEKLGTIKKFGYLYGNVSNYSKTSLLELQRALYVKINTGEKDFNVLKSVSLLAEAMKIQHALELIETQSLQTLYVYLKKIEEEAEKTKVKAVQNLVRDINFRSAIIKTEELIKANIEHPKLTKLKQIINEEVERNPEAKIIIFNQYRDSTTKIKETVDSIGVSANIFIGQTKKKDLGMTQKEQKQIIQDFREKKFNCLIATSVAEEGLDIPQVDMVIFYEPIPSAIRSVQRRGRTGRQEKGKVMVLIASNTRDEINFWSSHHKEKRMNSLLKNMKHKFKTEPQTTIEQHTSYDELLIYADHREKGSGIIKELSEKGAKIELSTLEVGDYLLSDRVVVEYKKVRDFVDSIVDGRLLAQLKSLKKYSRPVIIIEGEENIYSQRKIHPNAIRGMLSTIAISYGIPLIQTKNHKETSELLLIMTKKEHDPDKKDYTLHTNKPLSDKELQEYVVGSLPGIGPTIAKPLLKKFETIKKLVNSEEKELRETELIGEKKAQRIKEILEKKYDDSI